MNCAAANMPGVKSVQPLVYDRVTLPDLDGRVAVLIGAEVSTQLLTRDNPLKVTVEFNQDARAASTAPGLRRDPGAATSPGPGSSGTGSPRGS